MSIFLLVDSNIVKVYPSDASTERLQPFSRRVISTSFRNAGNLDKYRATPAAPDYPYSTGLTQVRLPQPSQKIAACRLLCSFFVFQHVMWLEMTNWQVILCLVGEWVPWASSWDEKARSSSSSSSSGLVGLGWRLSPFCLGARLRARSLADESSSVDLDHDAGRKLASISMVRHSDAFLGETHSHKNR